MTERTWLAYLKPYEREALDGYETELAQNRKDAAANSKWRKVLIDRAMRRERIAKAKEEGQ